NVTGVQMCALPIFAVPTPNIIEIGIIVIINQIVPIKPPFTPDIEGVEDEKLVKNDGVKCPAPLMSVSIIKAAKKSKATKVHVKNAHLLNLFVANLLESFFSTFC